MPSIFHMKNRRTKIVTFLIICKKKNAQNIDICCLGKRFCCFRQIIRAVGANYYSLTAQPAMHANNSIDSNKVAFHYDIRHSFYFTSMLFRFLVVVDAYKKDVAGVFGNLQGIVLALNLVESRVDGMVEFQLYDEGGLVDIATGNHHKFSSLLISHDLCNRSKGDTWVTAGRRPAAVPRQKRIRDLSP